MVVLSLTALLTNDVISSRHRVLEEYYIPAGNLLRNLDSQLAELEESLRVLTDGVSGDELDPGFATDEQKQQISAHLSQLLNLADEEAHFLILASSLEQGFHEYFSRQDRVRETLVNALGNAADKNIPVTADVPGLAERVDSLHETSSSLHGILERLSTIITDRTRSLVSTTYELSQFNLYIIVTISLLVIGVIIAGISLVIFRIDQPLGKVTAAMHDLSEGDMSRRIESPRTTNDEFTVLSEDFNRFARRTQALFDEVVDARDALEASEKRTRAILENALVGIVYVKQQRIFDVNEKFLDLFGYTREEITGLNIDSLYASKDDLDTVTSASTVLLNSGNTYQGEWQMKQKNGNEFWCAVSAKSLSAGNIDDGIIWLFEDITRRKNQENELMELANFDTLTRLPNRSLFMDRLQQGINRAGRDNKILGLLYIDLDRFKTINDSLGHNAGDELLRIVAGRISESVRGSDTVSRLGGDEFTVILPELLDISDAGKVAEKVINMLANPCNLYTHDISITPSIGVSIYPGDADNWESLLKNAESAMYHAKSTGRNNYSYYTQSMNARARQRLERESKLRRAVDDEQFRLYYQPQVDVHSMKITGYEALIRWQETEDSLVSPDQFVPLLEDTGLIIPVGEWILYRACHDIPELTRRNKDFKSVSINLSARQFIDDSIARRITAITSECGISPEHVVIEITESLMMTETQRSLAILTELNRSGFHLSLDDFGTGYSSLAYLRQFPIDVIKIDQSFVRGML
ncbi:MAG TPA: EAL domain-containing protein, partial [Gammaproteobacteria bacterium]|nr:EAL domain-containing protein [Gammaproteobacteria bacterium]